MLYRTETFAARRAGGAVQSISAEADQTALLRFYGWMAATNRPEVGDSIVFMIRDDLGDIAQEYAQWLQATQRCKFSTIANYINGLVSITSYCYATLSRTTHFWLAMDPNPLTQLINLRGQAEKASKTQQLYDKRVGGWMEWEDVQKARVTATKKLEDVGSGVAPAAKRNLLRDCSALLLLSLIPPDRVGCIRRLRFGHTLKRKPGGDWMMDLLKQRDGRGQPNPGKSKGPAGAGGSQPSGKGGSATAGAGKAAKTAWASRLGSVGAYHTQPVRAVGRVRALGEA